MSKMIQTNRGMLNIEDDTLTKENAVKQGFSYSFTAYSPGNKEKIGEIYSKYSEKGINYPDLVLIKERRIDDKDSFDLKKASESLAHAGMDIRALLRLDDINVLEERKKQIKGDIDSAFESLYLIKRILMMNGIYQEDEK